MAITNLTNTSWYFNETISSFGISNQDTPHIGEDCAEFFINFYAANNYPYTSLDYALGSMSDNVYYEPNYDPTYNFVPYEGGSWTDEDCRTIWITGGDDVTNPDLISWLTQNATQVENPTIITDVTNTSWYFNDILDHWGVGNIKVVVGGGDEHWSEFNINFTSNNAQYTSLYYELETGTSSDNVNYYTSEGEDTEAYWVDKWDNEAYKTITITGGEAATDPLFIVWLTKNATQVTLEDSEEKPSATFDLSTLNLPAGTHTVYVTLSAEGYRDSEPSNVVEYKITEEVEEITPYLTFSSPSSFTLKTNNSYKNWDGTLEYSTDTSTWDVWDGKTTLSADDGKLYLRGTGNTKITGSATYVYPQKYWILTGENISCDGNIETLLDYETVINGQHPIMSDYCYTLLFNKCEGLISAPALPTTTLTQYCYSYMFDGCTGLTTIPALPATTLADYCYYYMFNKCTNIKISTTQNSEYNHEYRIPTNDTGTTANQALLYMFSSTGGTFTYTPSINTTYYTSNTVVY